MKAANLLKVRTFKDSDYDMICRWCSDRRRQPAWHRAVAPPREILPPIGVIVLRTDGFEAEDLAAMFLYLAQGSPVCFAEHCVTKPGLSLGLARKAIVMAQDYLEKMASTFGCHVMVAHVLPAMARYMQHMDWGRADGDLIAMWKAIKVEEACLS